MRDLQDVVHDSTATSGDECSTSVYLSKEQEDSFQHLDAFIRVLDGRIIRVIQNGEVYKQHIW